MGGLFICKERLRGTDCFNLYVSYFTIERKFYAILAGE